MNPITLSKHPQKAIIAAVFLLFLTISNLTATAQEPVTGPDVIIKIARLSDTLDLVDKLAAEHTGKSDASLTAVVRGSLMGTNWIDPTRLLVVGVGFVNGETTATALIPFREPNADFQSAYAAKPGPGYYLVALPQGSNTPVPASVESALLAASNVPQEKLISIDMAMGRLIEANGDKIEQILAGIEQSPQATADGQPPPPITAEDARKALENTVETLKQVNTLSIDFDLNQETLSLGYQVAAAGGSRLAEVFAAGGETVSLGSPPASEQISFASRSYNLAGILSLLGDTFGDMYQKMGIDFAGLEKISRGFTGEMIGGMTLEEDRIEFEFLALLSEGVSPDEFLEKEYIPWLLEYGRQMQAVADTASSAASAEPIALTPESTVNGHRVLGCRIEMPTAMVPGPTGPVPSTLPITGYEMRLATVGPVLAVASSDARLAKLLTRAGNIQPHPATGGPLMTGEVDLAGYLSTLRLWVQKETGELPPLPTLGKMLFEGDMAEGRAAFNMSFRLKDLAALVGYANALKPAVGKLSGGPDEKKPAAGKAAPAATAEPQPGTLKVPPKKAAVAIRKDAEYWANRAYLCTTYGNDESAIHFFKKAIALSPNSSNLYFQMGVSYAELGYYQAALAAIDKAIALGGDKGLYYYGRGRVLLQSGKMADGMAEIEKAAGMGDPDAIEHIRDMGEKPAG